MLLFLMIASLSIEKAKQQNMRQKKSERGVKVMRKYVL